MIYASFDVADFIVLFYVLSVYPVMDVINILILILILCYLLSFYLRFTIHSVRLGKDQLSATSNKPCI